MNLIFLLATRERATPLDNADVATATIALSEGAFSAPSAPSERPPLGPLVERGAVLGAQKLARYNYSVIEQEEEEEAAAAAVPTNTKRRLVARSSSDGGGQQQQQQQPSSERPKAQRRRKRWRTVAAQSQPPMGEQNNEQAQTTGVPLNAAEQQRRRRDGVHHLDWTPRLVVQAGGSDKSGPALEPPLKLLQLSVKSSREQVRILVNGVLVHESGDKAPIGADQLGRRGVHVLVLNQFDGALMAKRTFDTYVQGQDDELCLFLKQLRPGRLVVFAVQDEASFGMAPGSQARKLLQSNRWASKQINKLQWRDMWAMVTRLGGPQRPGENLAERLTKSAAFSKWAPPSELELQVQLEELGPGAKGSKKQQLNEGQQQQCAWALDSAEERQRRAHFCSLVEGYGRVCDCDHPAPIAFAQSGPQSQRLDHLPVVVIASNRAHYLYRMLRSLLQARGLNSSLVTIFVDGFYEEPAQVGRLFNLRVIQQQPMGARSARISHHYKSALAYAFDKLHPDAKYACILEEDLDVARDALIYFNSTIELLERDPSLLCASAWNDQGYEHAVQLGNKNSRLLRVETMPGLGWLLSRRLFQEELRPKWPGFERAHDWDMWIRTPAIRRARECLVPELSRTYHFGSSGTNVNSYFQSQYFAKHAFELMSNVGWQEFVSELDHLQQDQYELLVNKLISSAQVVQRPRQPVISNDTNENNDHHYLCSLANGLANNRFANINLTPNGDQAEGSTTMVDRNYQKTFVIYIQMNDLEDYANWLRLAQCWRLWDLDARGQHKAMWRLRSQGAGQLFVVGSPASPYARLHQPAHVRAFDLRAKPEIG